MRQIEKTRGVALPPFSVGSMVSIAVSGEHALMSGGLRVKLPNLSSYAWGQATASHHIRNAQPRPLHIYGREGRMDRKASACKTDGLTPQSNTSMSLWSPRFLLDLYQSLLQSKLMEGPLIIRMLLLSLELRSYKKYATATA